MVGLPPFGTIFAMVLTVPLEDLAATAERLNLPQSAWLSRMGPVCRVSVANPDRNLLLRSDSGYTIAETRKRLEKQGFECFDGLWSADGEGGEMPSAAYWISAVSYKSGEGKPGLWVDAVPHRPLVGDVLKAMYEEFRGQGELEGVDLDAFIRLLDPTVIILDPGEQDQFVQRHLAC